MAAGDSYTLALKTDGSLWAWGDNDYGQLGDGTKTPQYTPQAVILTPTGPSDHVVISEVYTRGGEDGALYNVDYIELFNPTDTAVDLSGWTLQFGHRNYNNQMVYLAWLNGCVINPGAHLLIAGESADARSGGPLPVTPDVVADAYPIDWFAQYRESYPCVALVSNGEPVFTPVLDASDLDIVDRVAWAADGGFSTYGTGEGATNAAEPDLTHALLRMPEWQDTNNTYNDFVAGVPAPQNQGGDVNAVPVAVDDSYTTSEDAVLTAAAPGVLGNDSDADDDALSAALVTAPTNGTLALSTDGSFTYTPDPDHNGTDTFTYKANDGTVDSAPATVSITVAPVNEAPTIDPIADTSVAWGDKVTFTATGSDIDSPSLTYSLSADAPGTIDPTSGAYSWTPGRSDIGTHAFSVIVSDGSLTAETQVHVEVVKRALTVTAQPACKTYDGTTDSTVSPTITAGSLAAGDTADLSQTYDSENVGAGKTLTPAIAFTSGSADYYDIAYKGDTSGKITARKIEVTAEAQSKTYGEADSTPFSYAITSGSLVAGDAFAGKLARDDGENVGTHDITLGTLSLGANYELTCKGAELTINPMALTVTANDEGKTYGDAFSFAGTEFKTTGLVDGDSVSSITLSSVGADKTAAVGAYDITASAAVGTGLGNYTISYEQGTLEVQPRTVTGGFTAADKDYDGTKDAAITGRSITSGLVGGDAVSLSGGTASFPDKNVGVGRTVTGTGFALTGTASGNYALAATTLATTATIKPAALSITAKDQTKTFGDLLSFTGSEFRAEGLLSGDSVSSVSLSSAGAGRQATVGTYNISAEDALGSGLGNYTISYHPGSLKVVAAATSVALTVPAAQYSDSTTFTATVSPVATGSATLTGAVQFAVAGKNLGGPVAIDASGVATCMYPVASQAGSYPVTATFTSTNANFASPATPTAQNLVVSPEDATLAYSGDSLGVVKVNLNLQATVADSAAAGYGGPNPEAGTGKTIGDITKMAVAFDVYPVGSTTPTATLYAPVRDTGTAGDGIGSAAAVWTSATEGSYQVVTRLVGASPSVANTYYTAPNAEAAAISFYANSGQFAIGAGWLAEPTGGCGNFGLAARYDAKGKAKGQFVYVWRGSYKGTAADFVIRSNSLSALSFAGSAYPLTATLSGAATLQVIKACGGSSLYSESGLAFTAKAVDSGKSSGVGSDTLSLTLTGSKAPFLTGGMKSFSVLTLKGGNVVIHLK